MREDMGKGEGAEPSRSLCPSVFSWVKGQRTPRACGLQGCCRGGTWALPRCSLHGDVSRCGPWTASLGSRSIR